MKIFEVTKATGTYADSLMAIGTADLLEEISSTQAVIRDMGPYYQIDCLSDIVPEQLRPPSPGYYYIWRKSKEKEKPHGELILDYEEEKIKADMVKKSVSKKKKDLVVKALEEQELTGLESVHQEYRAAAILESMRKGWSSDKDVYKWIVQHSDNALAWIRRELLNEEAVGSFSDVSNSQFFNPISGKGVHAAKTRCKSPSAISNEVVKPFAEWMKYRGAYKGMLSYRIDDDFKLFVIEPAEIGPKAVSILRKRLLDLNLWGGIKLDIESALRLVQELILQSDVVQEESGKIRLRGKRPPEIIKGLRQAFFKSMGTAPALMNDAFLPLPGWFSIENRDDANVFLGIIKEHIGDYEGGQRKQGCLGSLDEKHSVDVPILQQYRRWLTTGAMFDLLDFFAKFAFHIMERRGKNEWVKEFSTGNLTILFGRGYDMKEIVEDAGFLSVARAIRNCTIYAVSLGERDPHFGLAQQWKQKIKGGSKEFIPVLCDFVQTQNWEVEHRLKGKGHAIDKKELDSVIALVDKYGEELVGMLLLAYGYARAPRVENKTVDSTKKEGK